MLCKLFASFLRREENALWTKPVKRLSSGTRGFQSMRTTAEFTLGGGLNAPGGTVKPQLTIKGNENKDGAEAGNITFSTSDSPSKVMEFYQDKVKELGMKVNLTTNTGEGAMLMAADENNHRELTVIVSAGGSDGTGVNLSYTMKK